MWCRNCNIETNEKNCPICGHVTEEDIPIEVMWCPKCRTPIVRAVNDQAKHDCPLCYGKVSHMSTDLRPVFPEERLLLELLLDKKPNEYVEKSVWASNSRYYIDGKSLNDAYRLGYDRVGCWCCPNNNQRAQFLSRIYMPEQSKRWRDFLIHFAEKIGKPDPEVYVDSGKWKARQGGNGLASAGDVKIRYTNCTAEEHAKIYRLVRPFDDELVGMFVPFGRVAPELGKKLLKEVIVLDSRSNEYVVYLKRSNSYLQLKQSSGVDIQQKISDVVERQKRTVSIADALNDVNMENYLYPSRYNDAHEMIRYFDFTFIEEEVAYKQDVLHEMMDKTAADGVIFGVLPSSADAIKELHRKVLSISSEFKRAVFVLPTIIIRYSPIWIRTNSQTIFRLPDN